MGILLLLLLLQAPVPEKHRGPAQDGPTITVQNEGPLVIPAKVVVNGALWLFGGYTTLIVMVGRMVWMKKEEEVKALKTGLEAAKVALTTMVDVGIYEQDRDEDKKLIERLDAKVDRHHEFMMTKVDKNHGVIMGILLQDRERRSVPREET